MNKKQPEMHVIKYHGRENLVMAINQRHAQQIVARNNPCPVNVATDGENKGKKVQGKPW